MAIPITVVGNLTRDPEVKILNGGKVVATSDIAVTERVNKGGQWQDGETAFYRVGIFDKYGEAFADTARKGDLVIATGTLKISTYEKDGVKKTSVDITAKHIGIIPKPNKTSQRDEGPGW